MSEVKDRPVEITLDGIEYKLLFNLNVVEEVLEQYKNIGAFTKALMGGNSAKAVKIALKALIDEAVDTHNEANADKMKKLSAAQIGRMLSIRDKPIIIGIIMEALKRSLPEPVKAGEEEIKK